MAAPWGKMRNDAVVDGGIKPDDGVGEAVGLGD